MKIRLLVKDGEYKLGKAFCMDPKTDAELLYCHLKKIDRVQLFMDAEKEADEETENEYMKLIKLRAERIPLQHILGSWEFMGFDFKVDPKVLIPRQDTEILVTEALRVIEKGEKRKTTFFQKLKGKRGWEILDLCCGSGAVGISLAKINPDVKVAGSDISKDAVALARENAKRLRVRADFLQGDMFEPHKGAKFDMIISNPPYIKSNMIFMLQDEVKKHEPLTALDGGRDGLDFYRRIVREAPSHLNGDGWLLLETGHDQGPDVEALAKESERCVSTEIIKDIPGKDRVLKCKYI